MKETFTIIDPDFQTVHDNNFPYSETLTMNDNEKKNKICTAKLLNNILTTIVIVILVTLMYYLASSFQRTNSNYSVHQINLVQNKTEYNNSYSISKSPDKIVNFNSSTSKINQTETSILPEYMVKGTEYKIFLKFISNLLRESLFQGHVTIKFLVEEDSTHIVISTNTLRIVAVKIIFFDISSHIQNILEAKFNLYDNFKEFLDVQVNEPLKPQIEYEMSIEFNGDIQQIPFGFFQIESVASKSGKIGNLIASNTNGPFTKAVFPYIESSVQKAIYQLNICRDEGFLAVTNTDEFATEVDNANNCTWQRFSPTELLMPAHLIGFVVSNYHCVRTTTKNGQVISVWALENSFDRGLSVTNITIELLEKIEDYFGIDLPSKNIDIYALSKSFPYLTSKMGIIIAPISETLIINQNEISETEKREIAKIIGCHLTEQWTEIFINFEDESDEWLKKSLVQYINYIVIESVQDKWQTLLELFDMIVLNEMDTDILNSNKKTSNVFWKSYPKRLSKQKPLYSTSETSVSGNRENYLKSFFSLDDENTVNPIIYSELFARKFLLKGVCLLRMLAHVLTETIFKNSIREFLYFGSEIMVRSDDLWNIMQSKAMKSSFDDYQLLPPQITVKWFVNEWISQNDNYPIVKIIRNYDDTTITFLQLDEEEYLGLPKKNYRYLPISFTLENEKYFNDTTPKLWLKPTKQTDIDYPSNLTNDTWLLINPQRTNLYRTNYDENNWKMLKRGLDNAQFPAIIRAQLFDEVLYLGRIGYLNYELALNMTSSLSTYGETEYIVWNTVLNHLKYIENILNFSIEDDAAEYRALFKKFIKQLITPVYNDFINPEKRNLRIHRVIKQLTPNHNDIMLLSELHRWACKVEIDTCISKVKNDFNEWKEKGHPENKKQLDSDFEYALICNAMKQVDSTDFEFLYDRYLNASSTDTDRYIYLKSLYCYKEIENFLPRILSGTLQDLSSVMHLNEVRDIWQALIENPVTSFIPFDYVVTNWKIILHKFGKFTPIIQNIIEGSMINIQDKDRLFTIYKLKDEITEEFSSLKFIFNNIIKIIKRKMSWKKNQFDSFINWLRKITK